MEWTEETRAEVEDAKASGCMIYDLPWELRKEFVDPLILPTVERINSSGWCWTAESCQGHPDATSFGSWFSNTDPMLRLFTRSFHYGRLLHSLADAYLAAVAAVESSRHEPGGEPGVFEVGGIRLFPCSRPKPPWREVLVYLGAKNVYQRNQGLRVFDRFSETVGSSR